MSVLEKNPLGGTSMRFFAKAAMLAATALTFSVPAAQAAEVEVLHWWTSGGEAAALQVLKGNLEKQGVSWKDMPVAGGSGVQAMTALKARVTAGDAPTAVQMLGFDIQDWAEQGGVSDLNELAAKEHWDAVVPAALQKFSKYEGNWIAAPVNVHSTNWVWLNKAALDKAGGALPTNFDEFVALLDKFKAEGVVPLAHGGQPWQDGTVFESVVISTGGIDFYKQALMELKPEALGSDTMKTVFDRMLVLKSYFDPNFSGRDWNLSSAMVIKGEAGAQVMGDWAKGEFINAGKKPGEDFVCIRFPGTQGTVTFNSDQFVMFKVGAESREAQLKMASAVMDPAFQIAFNKTKGSVPARTDIEASNFDACAQKGMADLKEAAANGNLVGSMAHGHAVRAGVKQAFFDVVTKQLNGQIDSAAAVKELVTAVAAAQ
jgi:glucose/mannose transport system substrate-binding protein